MMFIVRTSGATPPGISIKMRRRTPFPLTGETDFFCVGDSESLRAQSLTVVAVHDGWYPDDSGGGVAIFGQGRFWEVRDTPFAIQETDRQPLPSGATEGEIVDIRAAIFGA